MSSGRSDKGRKRDRYSIDSVSSDVLRQVSARNLVGWFPCFRAIYSRAKASDVAAELMNMSPRDALDLSVSDEEDDDLKVGTLLHHCCTAALLSQRKKKHASCIRL